MTTPLDQTRAMDEARAAFEIDYFGTLPMTSEARSRQGDGYSFSLPQTAWTTWWRAWQAAIASRAAPDKSLHAQAADLLRPFLKPGDKLIWRGSFRWFDDDGVLSNHYDSQELESLAADFGYEIDWDTNLKHAAIIRAAKETPQ